MKKLLVFLAVCGLAAGLGLGWAYHRYVVAEPGPEFDRRHILGIIAQESPVYYRDGITRVGVFFEDEHRDYVPFPELPRAYVASIVAAEDDEFWSHPGFDIGHIARAVWDNLTAGGVVAGGSTLTQQTAKNLFYRPDRSFHSKLVEALSALRLEAHFGKDDILEFYVNQFHVAGNGRGVGIAARHFFDKEPGELTVVESAFLAGLVKAPARFDPFVGDDAARAAAVARSVTRTTYVLQRVVAESAEKLAGPYPRTAEEQAGYDARVVEVRAVQAEARRALDEGVELPFRRGVFRYDASALVDEVGRRLAEPPFADVLSAARIDDPAKAGLSVITTLDEGAQRSATYGLWHHLTEVGVMLEGLGLDALLRPDSDAPRYAPDEPPIGWSFRTARVTGTHDVSGKRVLDVDLGGHACVVDRDGLVRIANAIVRGRTGNPGSKAATADVEAVIDTLAVDKVTWVSVRDASTTPARCDIEVRPRLQGSVVVLRDGEVLAMVGGNDNRNFNRATALRQMGSTWKSIVYHAALQLGWSTDDVLDNRRNVFAFSTTMYWPSPDHQAPEQVSLAWAGAKSENLASVWLLYHLLDRLTPAQVAELAATFGLAKGADESEDAYRLRIQRAGVLPTPSRVREAWFNLARQEVLATLPGTAHAADAYALTSLSYGWGFEAERARVSESWKLAALDRNWSSLHAQRLACGAAYAIAVDALSRGDLPPSPADAPLSFRVPDGGGPVEVACASRPDGFGPADASWVKPVPELFGMPLAAGTQLVPESELLVRGVHASTLDEVASAIERRALAAEVGEGAVDLYAPEVLYAHQDFRTLLAMKYVAALAKRYGVRTEVREVLAMPLGASELTLEEATMVYEGLTTGATWTFPGRDVNGTTVQEPPASTLLIARIRDDQGATVYDARPLRADVAGGEVGALTSDVLRQVVLHGTGTRAREAVPIAGAPLPVAGKTGTTNDFRNVAFIGYAPTLGPAVGADGASTWAAGPDRITVGVYVGYDDNTPMARKSIRLAGASGALPAWLTTVRGLAAFGLLGDVPARAPEGGWAVLDPPGLVRVPVDATTGLPVAVDPTAAGATSGPTVLVRPRTVPAALPDASSMGPERPVRIAPSTSEPDAAREPRKLWAPRLNLENAEREEDPSPRERPRDQDPAREPEVEPRGRRDDDEPRRDRDGGE